LAADDARVCEAHERKRRLVHDRPAALAEPPTQQVAHRRLMLDQLAHAVGAERRVAKSFRPMNRRDHCMLPR
jgi:hypothetical protein